MKRKIVRHGTPAAVLADRDLMAHTHLRMPRLFALGRLLQEHGVIERDAELPRDFDALKELLNATGKISEYDRVRQVPQAEPLNQENANLILI